jgi:FKBP-type peptidyl-prolyl cis-trans isomerase SlyD
MTAQIVRPGKYVSLTYRITDTAGSILEQTDLPVGYIHGGNTQLIGGMDDAVTGKQAGDQVELALSPEQGFGPRDPDLTFTDDLKNVPPEFRRVGAEVPMQSESGEVMTFYVTRIGDGTLTVDGNHPLAGKSLRVQVHIQEVRDPTEEEISLDGGAGALPTGSLH